MTKKDSTETCREQSRGRLLIKKRMQQRAWIYIAIVIAIAVLGPMLTGYLLPFSKVLLVLRNNAPSDAHVVIYLDGDLAESGSVPALYQVTYVFKVVGGKHTAALATDYGPADDGWSQDIDWSHAFAVGIYGSKQLNVNIDDYY